MTEIINLRQHRKRKARRTKAETANQNRAAHGRTKTEKQSLKANRALADRHLDNHKLTGKDD